MTVSMIQESPPTRLTVVTTTPAGGRGRWAADDPNPENQVSDIEFSTAMPGGFDTFSCSLARDPRRTFFDVEELADIKVYGPGGQIAWEGQLQQLPDQGGSSSALNPAGVGYQDLLNDDSAAAMIYIDQDLTAWGDIPTNRQLQLTTTVALGSVSTGSSLSGTPALILEVDGPWTTLLPSAESWYLEGAAAPGDIAKIYYSATVGTGVSNTSPWVANLYINGTAAGNTEVAIIPGTLSGVLAQSGEVGPRAFINFGYTTANAGAEGATYQTFWQLAVIGNHGLTIQGTWPSIGVLASDVAAHAINTWVPNLKYTTGTTGTIQPSSFIIPQLAFTDPGAPAAIIQQITGYELLDWAVWEGPTYWQNFRGESAKTRNWVTRVKPAQLQDAGPNVTRIWNGVIVQYTGVDGNTYTVGPTGSGCTTESADLLDTDPANPANSSGPLGHPRKRWTLLTAGTSTANTAIQIGQVYLAESKELNQSGQAAIVGTIQDDHGVWWPSWMVRAGDTIRFVDARDPSPRRIVSTDYAHPSRTNTIQLDQPPDSETALLERLSASIAPLGLS